MALSEILPFAQTVGANVLTQAAYAADGQRSLGNQPGIARSPLVNKAALQASAIAAGVALYVARNQGTNVTDQLTAEEFADLMEIVASPQLVTYKDFYVAAAANGGSDANDGLTPATPFLTPQHAVDTAGTVNNQQFNCRINFADSVTPYPTFYCGIGGLALSGYSIEFIGNAVTPANVIIEGCLGFLTPAINFTGITWQTNPIVVVGGWVGMQNCTMNAVPIYAQPGAIIETFAGMIIKGNQASPLIAQGAGAHINVHNALSVTGNPVLSGAFAQVGATGVIDFLAQPVGAATGLRYFAESNGVISTNGGGATWLPGSIAGSTPTGGQYV